jgi:hypothetical protein
VLGNFYAIIQVQEIETPVEGMILMPEFESVMTTQLTNDLEEVKIMLKIWFSYFGKTFWRKIEELDGPMVRCARRLIAKAKQRSQRSVI